MNGFDLRPLLDWRRATVRGLMALVFLIAAGVAQPCSTVLMKNGTALLVGHNLDMPSRIPGLIVKNNRGISKQGISWEELRTGKPSSRPRLHWTSKFGSITYNPIGRDFPDGGLNEAGLYIGEMSVDRTKTPTLHEKPRLFMANWIQYVLDTCSTVEEAIQTTKEIELDGWEWHFFLADKRKRAAVIEFLDGTRQVYQGKSLQVPALCNQKYSAEIDRLHQYAGFGGDRELDESSKNTPRFVCAASRLKSFGKLASMNSETLMEHCFETLKPLDRGSTQWSVVCDLKEMRLYFRTAESPKIRWLRFSDLDFSKERPVHMMDINLTLDGNVKSGLVDYTPQLNRDFVSKAMRNLAKIDPNFGKSVTTTGRTLENFIDALAKHPEQSPGKR